MGRATRRYSLWRTIGAIALALVCVQPLGCGSSSPTSPTPPEAPPQTSTPSLPTTFAGVWRANAKAVTCRKVAVQPCEAERSLSFVLRVAAGGPGFLGTVEIEEQFSFVVINVIGESRPDGSVLFIGSNGISPTFAYNVRRLLLRLDGASGLSGDFEFWTVAGLEQTTTGTVLSASYQPLLPQSGSNLSGTWSGPAVIRACTGYCPSFQGVGTSIQISLVIGQSGNAVTGQAQLSSFSCSGCWVPLSGTVSDDRLSLSGPVVLRDSPFGDRALQMESLEASPDYIGRLVGRFVYSAESRVATSNVSYRLECEISWLRRN